MDVLHDFILDEFDDCHGGDVLRLHNCLFVAADEMGFMLVTNINRNRSSANVPVWPFLPLLFPSRPFLGIKTLRWLK